MQRSVDDASKVGRWTLQEHSKFLIALEMFGKDWRKMSQFIGTRSNVQCRTHAQKHFKRLQTVTVTQQARKKGDTKKSSNHKKDEEEDTEEDSDKEELPKDNTSKFLPPPVSCPKLSLTTSRGMETVGTLNPRLFGMSQNIFSNSMMMNPNMFVGGPMYTNPSPFPMYSLGAPPVMHRNPQFQYLVPNPLAPRF